MTIKSIFMLCPAIWALSACKQETVKDEDLPDFLQTDRSFVIGAPLCVTGQFTAKASSLENALILAEEFLNGVPRAYPGIPVDDIPCRIKKNCGAWVGTNSTGEALRAPVRIVVGDTEGKDSRAPQIAGEMRDQYQPSAMIAGCTAGEIDAIYGQVTEHNTVLISPVVTADFVSFLVDRTAADESNDPRLPGYVYRTVSPDYVVTKVAATVGQNYPDIEARDYSLIRAEDETEDDCTFKDLTYCQTTYGSAYECHLPRSAVEPTKLFSDYTTENCGGQPDSYCSDKLGRNYACTLVAAGEPNRCSSGECCGRFRSQKLCTKIVKPTTAMLLYEDNQRGQGVREQLQQRWVNDAGLFMLSTAPYDPASPGSFHDVISTLFHSASTEHARLKSTFDGNGMPLLPANHELGDSVVFFVAQASEAALLLQEWNLQLDALPSGSEHVFWLGPDSLRSTLLTNQVSSEVIRNLFVLDPYTLDVSEEAGFAKMFEDRFGRLPDDYAGSAFDAALIITAANERAGRIRERNGDLTATSVKAPALDQNTGTDVKNSLPQITVGCLLQTPFRGGNTDLPCGATSTAAARSPETFATAIEDLGLGKETIVLGVTGNLLMSPAGDRMSQMKIWKIASRGSKQGFYYERSVNPSLLNAYLDY